MKPQLLQVGEAAQLRRYLPGQFVVVEPQPFQVGEAAQLRRYLPSQLVSAEGQPFPGRRGCPVPSVSPLSTGCWRGTDRAGWRGCPAPSVSPQSTGCPERNSSLTRPSGSLLTPYHSLIGRSLSQLVVIRPTRPARGIVKLDQCRPVLCRVHRCTAAAPDGGYTLEPCLECLVDRRAKP